MAGIAEIATILAWNSQSSYLSQSIFSLLAMKGESIFLRKVLLFPTCYLARLDNNMIRK